MTTGGRGRGETKGPCGNDDLNCASCDPKNKRTKNDHKGRARDGREREREGDREREIKDELSIPLQIIYKI